VPGGIVSKRSSKSSKAQVRALNYRHEVKVVHAKGALTTTVRATSAIAVWSNKRQNGPTVRINHAETFRFNDGQVVSSSITS
jgi:hypothetical protein